MAHGVRGRVDHGVQNEPSHLAGEQVRVHTAQLGPVRDAHVVQLVVAERLACQVHVAGRVVRRDVPEQLAGLPGAARAEVCGVLEVRPLLGGVSGVRSTDSAAWIALSSRQRTPWLAPTPRGSKLTRS